MRFLRIKIDPTVLQPIRVPPFVNDTSDTYMVRYLIFNKMLQGYLYEQNGEPVLFYL